MLQRIGLLLPLLTILWLQPAYGQVSAELKEATKVAQKVMTRESWVADSKKCPSTLMPPQQVFDYLERNDCKTGRLTACLAKCAVGDPGACYWTAYALQQTKLDPQAAEVLYQRSCKLGVVSGCTNRAAGILVDTPDDPASQKCAADTFSKACAFDDPWGCTMYALHLIRGTGVPPNKDLARKVLEKSCRYGPDDQACIYGMRLQRGSHDSETPAK